MPETEKELMLLQLKRAEEIIGFIPGLIELGDYNTAVNRAYYAAFHAIKALEIPAGFDSKKHSGAISFFREHYIKTGELNSSLSDAIGRLSAFREQSDYNITVSFNSQDALERYNDARMFVSAIVGYCKKEN